MNQPHDVKPYTKIIGELLEMRKQYYLDHNVWPETLHVTTKEYLELCKAAKEDAANINLGLVTQSSPIDTILGMNILIDEEA